MHLLPVGVMVPRSISSAISLVQPLSPASTRCFGTIVSPHLTRFSNRGKSARAKNLTPHTTGSKSFARQRDEYETTHGSEPGRLEFFMMSHKKKDGSYVTPKAQELVETAQHMITDRASSSIGSNLREVENEVFTEVMGRDKYGRVKGYGLGVSPTQIHGRQSSSTTAQSMEVTALELRLEKMEADHETHISKLKEDYEGKIDELKSTISGFQADLDQFRQFFSQGMQYNTESHQQ